MSIGCFNLSQAQAMVDTEGESTYFSGTKSLLIIHLKIYPGEALNLIQNLSGTF